MSAVTRRYGLRPRQVYAPGPSLSPRPKVSVLVSPERHGRPVDLGFLLLIPATTKEHLQALACVSRRLRDQAIASNVRNAADGRELYEALTKNAA